MNTLKAPAGPGQFLAGLVCGLALGAVVAVAATLGLQGYRSAHQWIDAGAVWVRLPSQIAAGPLPQTFAIPAKAYDYGAETRALEPVVTEGPAFLRVQLGDIRGSVGLSLAKPDGSALLSKERPLTAKDSGRAVYFPISGREGPVGVLARNSGAEGQAGSVTVKAVAYIPQAAVSKDQMSQINAAGAS